MLLDHKDSKVALDQEDQLDLRVNQDSVETTVPLELLDHKVLEVSLGHKDLRAHQDRPDKGGSKETPVQLALPDNLGPRGPGDRLGKEENREQVDSREHLAHKDSLALVDRLASQGRRDPKGNRGPLDPEEIKVNKEKLVHQDHQVLCLICTLLIFSGI